MPGFDDYNPTIRWVQLSDLHMTIKGVDRFNIKNILPKLIDDIKKFNPHFLIFSGDISYSGKQDEFSEVERNLLKPLLKCKNLSIERIFLTPGNHDVDWNTLKLVPLKIFSKIDSQNQITELFQDSSEFNILQSAHSEYYKFSQSYGDNLQNTNPLPICHTNTFKLKRKEISVMSLSSAVLSRLNIEPKKGEVDYGKLAIGEYQICEALSKINKREPDIMIAITHHPLSYLYNWDKRVIENYFSKHCDFHCFGHSHFPNFECRVNPTGKLISLQTGALFSDYHDDNTYIQTTWYLNSHKVNIEQRKFNKTKLEWFATDEAFEVSLKHDDKTSTEVERLPLNLHDYDLNQSSEFQRNLKKIGISFEEVLSIIQKIFEGHINYFRRDFDKLPITLDKQLIVLLSKTIQSLEFHRIVSCTKKNSGKLLEWQKIIFAYRKSTYFAYREYQKETTISSKEFNTAHKSHKELSELIVEYFNKYEPQKINYLKQKSSDNIHFIEFNLRASHQELEEAKFYFMDRRNFPPAEANAQLILHLEASLMHLHKIVSSYFPGDKL